MLTRLVANRPPAWSVLLYLIFLVSGFSSLSYQVVWIRNFGLVFGVTAYATSAVLSSFFGGLALGSWLAGRYINRLPIQPLRLYAFVEISVAAYAVVLPHLQILLESLLAIVAPGLQDSFYLVSLLRLTLSGLVLIIPTTLMGATLPLVTQALSRHLKDVMINMSGLYTANTLGALTGAMLSGFYLIGQFGMSGTTALAMTGNLVAGLGALAISSRLGETRPAEADSFVSTRFTSSRTYRLLPVGLFLSGFAAIGYEVVWTRVLALFMDRTVFAYTTVLSSALLGIALGSWMLRMGSRLIRNPMRVLATLEMVVGCVTVISVGLVSQAVPSQAQWGIALGLGVTLVFPNALLGAALPLAVRVYQEESRHVSRRVGDLYAADVLGGVVGSFATGFIFLTVAGSQYTLVFLAALNIFVAILFFRQSEPGTRRLLLTPLAVSIAGLAFLVFQPRLLFAGIQRGVFAGQKVLFHQEDVEGIVTVTEVGDRRTLYLNGSRQTDTTPTTVAVHHGLADLPLLLHPEPRDVLIIGLGGGATAGEVTRQPVRSIRIVELIPGISQGAAYFESVNYRVLEDRRVSLRVDDGRNFLMLTPDRFDIIECDVVFPWHAGANNLYATEYYKLIAQRLKPGGVVAQWLDTTLAEEDYKLLLRTFVTVFPNTLLWNGGSYAIAMPRGVSIDPDLLHARYSDPAIAAALAPGEFSDPDQLLQSFVMGPDAIQRYVGSGRILTDDHPYLEYTQRRYRVGDLTLPKEDVGPFLVKR